MAFWQQGQGGDWRLVAAVQQPSLESGGSQIDVFLSEYNIFDVFFLFKFWKFNREKLYESVELNRAGNDHIG